jgi:ribosomal-protein-serine acetyltransferase
MPVTNPLLLNIPEQLETERLLLRVLRPGDGKILTTSVTESHESLRQWMPWAKQIASQDENEEFVRRAIANFTLRTELNFALFERDSGEHVGMSGFHHIDWSIPHLEMGYWLRTRFEGKGYMTEAARHLTRLAFETLSAERVEIRCDTRNQPSAAVAERAGYTREALFRCNRRDVDDALCDTYVYAVTRPDWEKM